MEQLEYHTQADQLGPDDIAHWISVYEELVEFLTRSAAEIEPGPMREDLESRAAAYRGRLSWWRQFQVVE